MTEIQDKVEYIVTWYNKERVRFSFAKQMILAKTWMDIFTKNEEYEIALGLMKEKEKVLKEHIAKKKQNRTFKQKGWFFIIKLKRKLKNKGS